MRVIAGFILALVIAAILLGLLVTNAWLNSVVLFIAATVCIGALFAIGKKK